METKIMQAGLAARQQDPAREQEMHGLATAPNFSANWFAAYTNSHHEKSVASHFAERQIESFLPLYATLHRWKNRCEMNLELPLFPNYVFVRIDPSERVRIKSGPMTGMEGVLVRKKNNFRVVLALDLIMQCVAVEVDADDLEPAVKCGGRVHLPPDFAGQHHSQTQPGRPL